MQHIFELLARAGANEVHVNVHYLADAILGRYGEGARLGGTQIHFHREKMLMGTAGGVKRVSEAVSFEEAFVVIMGDTLTDVDLRELLTFHKRKGAAATLALMRVEDTSEYGVAELDAEKNILSFQEKPDSHKAVSNLANTGIYVLEPGVPEEYVPEDAFFDFAEDVFPTLLAAGEKLVGYENGFYWSDIGTLESYRTAQRDALLGRVAVQVPGERWGKSLWVGDRAWIHPSAYGHIEGHAVVGQRAMIGRRASLRGVVAVGDDCRISEGATIKQSVLLPGSSVGSGAYLEDCIVGPGYEIRPGHRIRGGALVQGAA